MFKTISADEVSKDLRDILQKVSSKDDTYLILRDGMPSALLISLKEFSRFQEFIGKKDDETAHLVEDILTRQGDWSGVWSDDEMEAFKMEVKREVENLGTGEKKE